jgi:hypothetical protein
MAEDMTDRYGRRSGRRIDSARDRALPGSAGPTAHDPRSRRRTGRRVPGARDSLRCSLPCATPACPAGRSRAIRTPIRRATTSSRTPPTTPARHIIWLYRAKSCPTSCQKVAKKSISRHFWARRPHAATLARNPRAGASTVPAETTARETRSRGPIRVPSSTSGHSRREISARRRPA